VILGKKKVIQVWSRIRMSKWWHHLHFWVSYSFNQRGSLQ